LEVSPLLKADAAILHLIGNNKLYCHALPDVEWEPEWGDYAKTMRSQMEPGRVHRSRGNGVGQPEGIGATVGLSLLAAESGAPTGALILLSRDEDAFNDWAAEEEVRVRVRVRDAFNDWAAEEEVRVRVRGRDALMIGPRRKRSVWTYSRLSLIPNPNRRSVWTYSRLSLIPSGERSSSRLLT